MNTLVIYTDGACKRNPGPAGYGAHMLVTDKNIKPKQILSKYKLTNKGYIAKNLLKVNKPDDVEEVGLRQVVDIFGYTNSDTNNRAELDGVIQSLLYFINVKAIDDTFEDITKVVIRTDSNYVIGMIAKLEDPDLGINEIVANQDKAKELDKILRILREKNIELEMLRVAGHSGDLGNDRADLLANMGAYANIRGLDEQVIISDTGNNYWKLESDRPPLLDNKLLFRYSNEVNDKDLYYYGLNYDEDDQIGKRSADVIYQVYHTPEPVDKINEISTLFNSLTEKLVIPYTINLDNLYHKQISKNLNYYKEYYLLTEHKTKRKVVTVDGIELASEVYPPSLSMLALEISDYLKNILKDYIEDTLRPHITTLDITNEFYNLGDKTTLKKEVKNKDVIKVKVGKGHAKIVTGLDTPKRNSMKKIEKLNPKVELILIDRKQVIEFFTITSYDGENGREYLLVDNHYANIVLKH